MNWPLIHTVFFAISIFLWYWAGKTSAKFEYLKKIRKAQLEFISKEDISDDDKIGAYKFIIYLLNSSTQKPLRKE